MAEFPTITNPEKTDDFDFSQFLDTDQWMNMTIGINRSIDGVSQSVAEMEELLGLEPKGWAEFRTQQLKEEQAMMRQSGEVAGRLSGAGGVQVAGEILPLFGVPFGSTVRSAAALGGLASSGFFHDDVRDSRVADIALGAAGGGLFRALLRGGRAAADAKGTLNQMESGQKLLTHQPRRTAGLGPQDFAPGAVRPGQVPGQQLATIPQRAGRQATPVQGQLPSPGGPGQKLLTDQGAIHRRAAEVLKQGGKGAGEMSARAVAKVRGFSQKAAAKAARIKEALKRSTVAEKEMLTKALARAESEVAASGVLMKSLRAGGLKNTAHLPGRAQASALARQSIPPTPAPQKLLPAPAAPAPALDAPKLVKDMTVKELKEEITGLNPQVSRLGSLKKPVLQRMLEKMKEGLGAASANLSGRGAKQAPNLRVKNSQKGFANTDLQATISGASLGGVGVGALAAGASDGDGAATGIGMAAGALLGGAAGAKIARHAGRIASNTRKAGIRRTEGDAGKLNEVITRNKEIKDYSSQAIADTVNRGKALLDEFMGSTMTRLEGIAPRLAVSLKLAEYQKHVRNQQWLSEGDAVFSKIDALRLTDAQNQAFEIALLNSTAKAKTVLRGFGKDESVVDELSVIMDDMAQYLKSVDLGDGLRKNYFPRMVTDTSFFENIPEFRNYLGKLADRKGVADLTDFEKQIALSEVINGAMQRGEKNTTFGKAASQLQKRAVKVDPNNKGAYAGVREGFHDYVDGITTQVERRKFFEGQKVDVSDLGPNAENIDNVAERLAKQLAKGDLTEGQVDEATRLIRMRFGPGEQAPNRAIQNFKNLTYMGLLANPFSAATQFGDVALSAHRNGIANTVSALIGELGGRGKLNGINKTDLLGIRNASADFASQVGTRDALNWGLKYSGFAKMDELGKNTFIQSAMLKNKQMKPEDFKNRWSKIFDPEAQLPGDPTPRTDKLLQETKGFTKITDANREDIGFMLWNELEGVQPIALSALPERYLRHPNGRMGYMLQSFTLKVFDVMRKDIIQNISAGNYKQAAKEATSLSTLFVTTNSGVDTFKSFMLNKETDVPDIVVNNYLKMLGMNKFMLDGVTREGLGDTLLKQIAPPLALPNALTSSKKALQQVPLVGRAVEGLFKEGGRLGQ
jgi:hypothetical protein